MCVKQRNIHEFKIDQELKEKGEQEMKNKHRKGKRKK